MIENVVIPCLLGSVAGLLFTATIIFFVERCSR